MDYKERKLRRKAGDIGYSLHKGLVHFMMCGGGVHPSREVGYNVKDETTGFYVWGSYNEVFDHQWSLDDCEDFIKEKYAELGLAY